MDPDRDLAALRPLGGFFVLRTPPPRPLPTVAQAYAPRTQEQVQEPEPAPDDPLALRVRKVAAALQAPETRVAASIAHQGLAARLWSVALACAVVYDRAPDLAPGLLHWDPEASAPDDLWLADVRPAAAESLADAVLTAHLAPLTEAVHTRYRLAPGLLWGNTASALAGAGRELARWAHRHGRTDAATRARTLTATLLAHPLLTDTGTLTPAPTATPTPTAPTFRRRSCCLYYRLPGAGVCGDCCFDPGDSPASPKSPC